MWPDIAEKDLGLLMEALRIKKEQYDVLVEGMSVCDMLQDKKEYFLFNKCRAVLIPEIETLEGLIDMYEDILNGYPGKQETIKIIWC